MAEPHRGRHSRSCIAASGLLVLAALTSACGSSLTQPSARPAPGRDPAPTPTPPRARWPSSRSTAFGLTRSRRRRRPTSWRSPSAAPTRSRRRRSSRPRRSRATPRCSRASSRASTASRSTSTSDTFQFATPTVFSLVRLAGKRTVMVVGKDKFKQLNVAGSTDSYSVRDARRRGRGERGDRAAAHRLRPAVRAPAPGRPDGPRERLDVAEYLAQLQKTDEAVGRLLVAAAAGDDRHHHRGPRRRAQGARDEATGST